MSHFQNKFENEKNDNQSINIKKNKKIKIINNYDNSIENKSDEINSINKMNY